MLKSEQEVLQAIWHPAREVLIARLLSSLTDKGGLIKKMNLPR